MRLGPGARGRSAGPLLLAWHLTPEWKFDPDPAKATEVEVLFDAEEDQTRVTLEHRGFEVHGEPGAAMRESVGSDGGWASLLELSPQPPDPRSFGGQVLGDRNPAWS